jgi:Fervidolysin N-terminal prodomain
MRSALRVAVLALAAFLPSTAVAETSPPAYAPGQVIVKFRSGVRATRRTAALRARGATIDRALPMPRTYVARLAPDAAVEQTVDGAAGAAGADIDAPGAWRRTTGSAAVKVAVVDSGINFRQPDLAPNIWRNPGEAGGGRETNGVDDDHDGFVDDWRGWVDGRAARDGPADAPGARRAAALPPPATHAGARIHPQNGHTLVRRTAVRLAR